jgi:hypothetical protein
MENRLNEPHCGKDSRVNGAAWAAWFCNIFALPASCRVTIFSDTQVPIYWLLEKGTAHLWELMAQNVFECMVWYSFS